MSSYVRAWCLAFAFTQAVEAPLYRRLLGCSFALGLVPSALTHPVLWFLIFPYVPASYVQKAIIGESFVVLVEGLCCLLWLASRAPREAAASPLVGRKRALWALAVALITNAASMSLGLLSRHLFGVL